MEQTVLQNKKTLPGGWRWARLGDISEVVSKGTTPTSLGFSFTSVGVPFLRAEDVVGGPTNPRGVNFHIDAETDEALSRSRLRPGDFLITIAGTLGRVGYVSDGAPPMNCNQAVAFARLKPELADTRFVCLACQASTTMMPLLELKAGGGIQNLNLEQVRGLEIPLPPLPDQKRIAAILNEHLAVVEKARTAAETQLESAEALVGSYLREAFSSPEVRKWKTTSIGKMTSLVIDGPHVTPTYVASGIPFLTVRNIVNRRIDLSHVSYVSLDDHAEFSRRGKAEPGDILYTKDGTLGIPCVVDTDIEFSFFVSVALIKLNRQQADPRFVAFALESPSALQQVERLGAGAGLKHMVLKSIRALEIPLPSLSEQRRIAEQLVDRTSKAHILGTYLQEQLAAINKLPAAILHRAFNGEL